MNDITTPVSLPITLRAARPDDALCLAALGQQVFLHNYAKQGIRPALATYALEAFSPASMAALMAQPHTWITVAECADHLVGFAQVTLGAAQELLPPGVPAELDRLYVQEPFTRCGVGSQLIAAAESQAAARGAQQMWLTPWVHNHRALAFYRKQQYRDVGLTWFEMDDGRHENRVLVKALTPPAQA